MSRPSLRLAVLSALSVLAALLVMLGIYNAIIHESIRADADEAVSRALSDSEDAEESSASRVAAMLFLTEGYGLPSDDSGLHNRLDRAVARWCADHAHPGELQLMHAEGLDVYLKVEAPSASQASGLVDPGELAVAYVDVTGELGLAFRMNVAFALVAVFGGAFAALAGWAVGRQTERRELAVKVFYENMSHEFKTPLAAIAGFAEGLQTGVIEDARHAGVVIGDQARRISDDIGQVLSLSRLESGAVRMNREELCLDELVQDCLLPLEGAIRTKGLSVGLALEPIRLRADAAQLEHAVSNLLVNAVQHAESRIAVRLDDRRLVIENDCASLSEEDLEGIFDRFRTGGAGQGGTGIGLALARQVAELHGWRLRARSLDDGVAFVIDF